MPSLLDLTFKPSADQETLPTGVYPVLAPAIYRGDSYSITFTLTDDGNPYEPEGDLFAEIRPARLKATDTPGAPLASFSITVNVNEVTIALTDTETAAPAPRTAMSSRMGSARRRRSIRAPFGDNGVEIQAACL